jgi:amidohydrolase
MTELARQTAAEVFKEKGTIIDNISMASEDFSEFGERVPGVFMFLGVGNPQKETHMPHHNPRFNIDEEPLPDGVEMYVRGTLNFFEKSNQLTFIKRR